jgi:CubicO group peptidase (beta-lactamase class C family)
MAAMIRAGRHGCDARHGISRAWSMPSSAGSSSPLPLLAAMTTPQTPPSTDVEQYGYGLELVVENDAVTIIGHGGADPGVSTMVSHHVVAGTTIVVLCN